MRCVYSHALMRLQVGYGRIQDNGGLGPIGGWEYLMLASLVMECARRGFILPSVRQHHHVVAILRERYGPMFEHKQGSFKRIHDMVRDHLSEVIYELRMELRMILDTHNLTQTDLYYSPADLVQCRYHIRSVEDNTLDALALRTSDAVNSRFLAL